MHKSPDENPEAWLLHRFRVAATNGKKSQAAMVIELPRKYTEYEGVFQQTDACAPRGYIIRVEDGTQPSGCLTYELSLTNSEIFGQNRNKFQWRFRPMISFVGKKLGPNTADVVCQRATRLILLM